MEQTPARLIEKPSWLLTQLSVHAHRLSADAFAEAGARGYHYRILSSLDEFGVASQAELGRYSNMDRSDVVAAVNELAEQGCVKRNSDPDDRRRNLVSLTKTGERQLRRLDRALDKAQESLLEPLAAEDRAALTRMLGQLLAHHQRTLAELGDASTSIPAPRHGHNPHLIRNLNTPCLGPELAPRTRKRCAPETVLIVDGTLVPTRDRQVAAKSKNF